MNREANGPEENLVWISKTHWPWPSPLGAEKFSAKKCISVVRNPIDQITSMAYLKLTNSHTKVTSVLPSEADPEWWDRFVLNVSKATNLASQTMREQVHGEIPVYYLRYEDLVLNPEPVLCELFRFLLSVESIEGTVIEKRIQDYVAVGSTSAKTYELKADPKKNLSRNAHMYSEE